MIAESVVWAWSFVLARALGLGLTAPVLAAPGLGPRSRLTLAVALTAVIGPAVAPHLAGSIDRGVLIPILLGEGLVGAAIGWAAGLVIAGARGAGEVVGAQAGLSAAALLDPDAGDDLTPMGHLYGLVALGVFLAMDGPLVMIRALVESYGAIPPGGLPPGDEAASVAFGRVGLALGLALRLAAPVAIAVSMAGVALGLIGRAAPALPMASMAVPVRYALGLGLALLGAASLAGTLAIAWRAWPLGLTGG